MARAGSRTIVVVIAVLAALVPSSAHAATSLPVFSQTEVPAGGGSAVGAPRAVDPPRRVDGRLGDWHGTPTRFGGSSILSSGELVYQDHIFDAYGADNGQDVIKQSLLSPAEKLFPESYRLDPAAQYLPGEFGVPTGPISAETHYGDLPLETEADLSEVRLGTDRQRNLWILARTTTMTAPDKTAILVLLDTAPGATPHAVPFNSGIHTTRAETALLLAGTRGWSANLTTGAITALPPGSVATDASGYNNAVEARIPAAIAPAPTGVAVASGLAAGSAPQLANLPIGPNLANVAFRPNEPSCDWWDKQQALTLLDRSIDSFFSPIALAQLAGGANQRYSPGPGYHDRIFESTEQISEEKGLEGILQHYGVYLPSSYRPPARSPLQFWFHFRGGTAHIAAAVIPRVFKDFGEDMHTIVVSPRGRGTSTWYVGKGQQDYEEVWADVHRTFSVDPRRTYISGHSMGGWATYLLTITHPDRFAAGVPASAPPTQGAWTGADFAGCDNVKAPDGETPCYTSANGGDPRTELTTPLLDNIREVPLALYHGAADELVPISGVARQVERLRDLGYRYRFYIFPHQEHYGPPIQDQWAAGARYEHSFVMNPNPARVTYIRSRPFENAIETINAGKARFDFDFDAAYWMSRLYVADHVKGVARFDGRSLAIPDPAHRVVPEVGGPAEADQSGPYAMTGRAWTPSGGGTVARPRNAFVVSISGATSVRLDMPRMRINAARRIDGEVTSPTPVRVDLRGRWRRFVRLSIDGKKPQRVRVRAGVLRVPVPAGHHRLVVSRG